MKGLKSECLEDIIDKAKRQELRWKRTTPTIKRMHCLVDFLKEQTDKPTERQENGGDRENRSERFFLHELQEQCRLKLE